MKKWMRKVLLVAVAAVALTGAAGLIRDRLCLKNDLVRLHIVANSDSGEDQAVKLTVRDAVLSLLQESMQSLPTAQEAKAYLSQHLSEIQSAAENALVSAGFSQKVTVTLEEEVFPARAYETFRLPSGVYDALRLTIGEGEGHNWWCVVFPSLCMPASSDGFQEAAEAFGMSDSLSQTLRQDSGAYQIRFRLLDWLGKLEALFCQ